MIRVLRSLTLVLAVLAFSFTLQPATAATVDDCLEQITLLSTATENADFLNPGKDQAALLGKLTEASDKLEVGKNDDAVRKLTDFRGKVGVLSTQQKIEPTDATELIVQATNAIGCIDSLT